MKATRHENMFQPPHGQPVWHTVRDAAVASGATESQIRRAVSKAGVIKISGRSVRGMVELSANGKTGFLPYCADDLKIVSREAVARTAEAWWAWHDQDQARWSQTVEEAESRCDLWVAGESDDGP